MNKVKIKRGPKKGDQVAFGLISNLVQPLGNTSGEKQVSSTMRAVPRDQANVEVEGGETVVGDTNNDGLIELFSFEGKRHSEGGMPVNLAPGSFIFSDTRKLKIKDKEVLSKVFNLSYKKGGYTPAEISKKYQINKYIETIKDKDADAISKRSASEMIKKNTEKLGMLALVQESMKGFPDGVPAIAESVMAGLQGGIPAPMQGKQQPQQEEEQEQPQADFGGYMPLALKNGGSLYKHQGLGKSTVQVSPYEKFFPGVDPKTLQWHNNVLTDPNTGKSINLATGETFNIFDESVFGLSGMKRYIKNKALFDRSHGNVLANVHSPDGIHSYNYYNFMNSMNKFNPYNVPFNSGLGIIDYAGNVLNTPLSAVNYLTTGNYGTTDNVYTDVVIDPLTYTGIGPAAKYGVKGAQFLGRQAMKYGPIAAELIAKYGAKAAELIGKYGQKGIELLIEHGAKGIEYVIENAPKLLKSSVTKNIAQAALTRGITGYQQEKNKNDIAKSLLKRNEELEQQLALQQQQFAAPASTSVQSPVQIAQPPQMRQVPVPQVRVQPPSDNVPPYGGTPLLSNFPQAPAYGSSFFDPQRIAELNAAEQRRTSAGMMGNLPSEGSNTDAINEEANRRLQMFTDSVGRAKAEIDNNIKTEVVKPSSSASTPASNKPVRQVKIVKEPDYSTWETVKKYGGLTKFQNAGTYLSPEGYAAIDYFEDTKGNSAGQSMNAGRGYADGSLPDEGYDGKSNAIVRNLENYIDTHIGKDVWNKLPEDIKVQMYNIGFNTADPANMLRGLAQAIDPSIKNRLGITEDQALQIIKNADFSSGDIAERYVEQVIPDQYLSIGQNNNKMGAYDNSWKNRASEIRAFYNEQVNNPNAVLRRENNGQYINYAANNQSPEIAAQPEEVNSQNTESTPAVQNNTQQAQSNAPAVKSSTPRLIVKKDPNDPNNYAVFREGSNKPLFRTYLKTDNTTTPTGQSSKWFGDANSLQSYIDKLAEKTDLSNVKTAADFQRVLYNYVAEKNPERLDKMWSDYGMTNFGIATDNKGKLLHPSLRSDLEKLGVKTADKGKSYTLDFSGVSPENKKAVRNLLGEQGYFDDNLGARTLDFFSELDEKNIPNVGGGEEEKPGKSRNITSAKYWCVDGFIHTQYVYSDGTTSSTPTGTDVKGPFSNPEEAQDKCKSSYTRKKSGQYFLPDIMNIFTAASQGIAERNNYLNQYRPEPGTYVLKDPTRQLAANQEQMARAQDQAQNTLAGNTAFASMLGASGQGFANAANVIADVENQNVDIVNSAINRDAQLENQSRLYNAQQRDAFVNRGNEINVAKTRAQNEKAVNFANANAAAFNNRMNANLISTDQMEVDPITGDVVFTGRPRYINDPSISINPWYQQPKGSASMLSPEQYASMYAQAQSEFGRYPGLPTNALPDYMRYATSSRNRNAYNPYGYTGYEDDDEIVQNSRRGGRVRGRNDEQIIFPDYITNFNDYFSY